MISLRRKSIFGRLHLLIGPPLWTVGLAGNLSMGHLACTDDTRTLELSVGFYRGRVGWLD